jgi:hypothetical protein
MRVGILRVRLHIPLSNSLKSKRRVIKSLKDRLASRYNISIAESDLNDKWQMAEIAVAAISNDKRHLNSTLSDVLNYIEGFSEVNIIQERMELI